MCLELKSTYCPHSFDDIHFRQFKSNFETINKVTIYLNIKRKFYLNDILRAIGISTLHTGSVPNSLGGFPILKQPLT